MTYRKHLISFDATRRSCTTAKTYVPFWETQPFDGMVLDATIAHGQISVAQPLSNWNASDYALAWSELATSLTDAQAIPFRKFHENYVLTKMAITAGYTYMDWWLPSVDAFIWNFRMAARFAKNANFRGVFFDPEPNDTAGMRLWKHADRPLALTKDFASYAARVRQVGQWCMEAMQDEFPNMNLVLLFTWTQAIKEHNPPGSTDLYGLFGYFVDGLLDAVRAPAQIHDFYEDGYSHYLDADITADNAIMNAPGVGINLTKRIPGNYHKSYGSFLDTLTTNIGTAVTKAHQQIVERMSNIYASSTQFMGATSVGTASQASIDLVKNARIALGYDLADDVTLIPGGVAYFRPAEMTGYSDTDPISSYTDTFGRLYTQAGGNRPTYKPNGIGTSKPGILFVKASSQSLVCDSIATTYQAAPAADQPFTVILVVKATANGANEVFFGLGRDATTDPYLSFGQSSASKYWFLIKDDAAGNTTNSSSASIDTAAHVITYIYSGTVLNMRVDGVNVLATNPYVTDDYGTMTLNRARVGCTAINTPASFAGFTCGTIYMNKYCLGLKTVHYLERIIGREAGIVVQAG